MERNGRNPGDSTPLVLAGWNPPLSWKAENFSTQGCQTVDDRRRVRSLVYQNMDVGTMTTQIFEMELDAAGSSLLRRLRHLTGWCLPSPVPVHRAGTGADLHVAGACPQFSVNGKPCRFRRIRLAQCGRGEGPPTFGSRPSDLSGRSWRMHRQCTERTPYPWT